MDNTKLTAAKLTTMGTHWDTGGTGRYLWYLDLKPILYFKYDTTEYYLTSLDLTTSYRWCSIAKLDPT